MTDGTDEEEPDPEAVKNAAEAAFKAALPPPGAPLMAARGTDPHVCPMVDGVKPHVGGPVSKGAPNVLIGGLPAARALDSCTCIGPPDMIARGSATVLIGGLPAARMGDQTVHGGVIVIGCPTVFIGG
jgi:uncharacterized Zn-binding protein involved in type VI secretion